MVIETIVPYPELAALGIILIAHVGIDGTKLYTVGPIQYFLHRLYCKYEPVILRIIDFFLKKPFLTKTKPGIALLNFIGFISYYTPHGIILTSKEAGRFLDHIEKCKGSRDDIRIAVGPCVCQRALKRFVEPVCKDIVILYGAEIFYHLKLGYRIISAKEAKTILNNCAQHGLVHSLDFCMQSGRWRYVICNCDKDICLLTRIHEQTGQFIYPGPEIVQWKEQSCRGIKKCGRCVSACMFGAIVSTSTKPAIDYDRCMGCGLCVIACKGRARTMKRRKSYTHKHIINHCCPIDFRILKLAVNHLYFFDC